MKYFFSDNSTCGIFRIYKEDNQDSLRSDGMLKHGRFYSIIYNRSESQQVIIDDVPYTFPRQSVLPLVNNQHFVFEHPEKLDAWQFNRDFYCIVDHDAEVGCAGFLFYGIRHPLFILLSEKEAEDIELIEQMCFEDLKVKDRMQGEMLRTLLKRLIISVTRIARKQTGSDALLSNEKLDIVRMFNLRLEQHFKSEHAVQFYANMLHRSPKTLSNLFASLNYPAPSKVIQNRLVIEAKRYLKYSGKTAKEIAYTLGFKSPAHFSRFFKQHVGTSISTYKAAQG